MPAASTSVAQTHLDTQPVGVRPAAGRLLSPSNGAGTTRQIGPNSQSAAQPLARLEQHDPVAFKRADTGRLQAARPTADNHDTRGSRGTCETGHAPPARDSWPD